MSEREIDRLRSEDAGPTLLIVGGIHGNEPAGVAAARRVMAELRQRDVRLRGEVIALIGNLAALAAGRRYLDRDLNRLWTTESIHAARAAAGPSSAGGAPDAEARELAELSAQIDEAIARARGPVHVVDLHTTSADGVPFTLIGDRAEAAAFARALPLPGILGLEGTLPSCLTPYLASRGCITLAIEGGQNESPVAVENHAAAITIALGASGVVAREDLPGWRAAEERLTAARGALPHTIAVVTRHHIEPEDGFRMEPGFANIQATRAGTLLARDRRGEIRAPFDGFVLLPLYQAQGSDGFFFGRGVSDAGNPRA